MPAHRLTISKDSLIELYVNQRLSSFSISKLLGAKSHVTILNYLAKYDISRRSRLGNRKPINIDKEILFDLYYKRKLSQEQIAKKFGCCQQDIQRRMKAYKINARSCSEANTKYLKFDFNNSLLEKAYLLGFRVGDLNVSKVHNLIQVRGSTSVKEQVELFTDLFQDYGNVHTWIAKRGTYESVALLNQSFEFLLPKKDSVEQWILDDKEYYLSFLAGYIDAEGSFYLRKHSRNEGLELGLFEIQSYDKNIITTIFEKLKEQNIECRLSINNKHERYKNDMCRITVNKKQSLWAFIKLAEPYLKHKKRLRDLCRVKGNLVLRNSLPYCRPITF